MSIQDDHFDIEAYFEEYEVPKYVVEGYNRIWEYFCDLEAEVDDLREIRRSVRVMIEKTFPQETGNAGS